MRTFVMLKQLVYIVTTVHFTHTVQHIYVHICYYSLNKQRPGLYNGDRSAIGEVVEKGPAADTTDAPQPWGFLCNPMMKMKMMMIIFCPFPSNGAPVELNWQGKTEELWEKPVPVPLCLQQIPHGLTRDRTRASAVGSRRLTAWAMARP
jgi:hypothetical protein